MTLQPMVLSSLHKRATTQSIYFGAGRSAGLTQKQIQQAFTAQNFSLSVAQVKQIKPLVEQGIALVKQYPGGNSQIGYTAINIGSKLGFNMVSDASLVTRIEQALKALANPAEQKPRLNPDWEAYFNKTISLTNNNRFLKLLAPRGYSPVKISWEDIGRFQGSVWGNRISDIGIWTRQNESDPESAKLVLSVRRDNNFRDKVLMVPSQNIKIHVNENGKTVEVSLPERLKQLGLTSQNNDDNVIVSNQFALVPVPAHDMKGSWKEGKPPRAAFTFSIQPYNSKNMVITDVMKGSSQAVVGGYNHQLLYANVGGEKAPFTASREKDRPDLIKMEQELKAQGMDVDVQRYYLIQIPLKNDAPGIQAANMGQPPREDFWGGCYPMMAAAMPEAAFSTPKGLRSLKGEGGLDKVAIDFGEPEGVYNEGSGYRGQRSEEPIRVTVVYFVTPKHDKEIDETDMKKFAKTFEQWDKKAIWGGSFVVPDKK